MTSPTISLGTLVHRFWKKTLPTWILVTLEGLLILFMPLVIGWAVDDLLQNKLQGLIQLGVLCMLLLFVGAGRRFYDTRTYAKIFKKVAHELVTRENKKNTRVSKVAARTNLFMEFIEFLENALPDIITQVIGFLGTLCVIAFIDLRVLWPCLAGAFITTMIYLLNQHRIFKLNTGQNNEYEKQVDILSTRHEPRTQEHFKNLMCWNIKLSDLETLNFSLTWIALVGVLLLSVLLVTTDTTASFGKVLSVIMYVFGFIESVMSFPLHYQQIIRLQEISTRLGA